MSDILVKCSGVAKKFCRSIKRSALYGLMDLTAEFTGRKRNSRELRSGEFWAVNDVSFEIRRGDCLGIIGPNGAGKSTLLKMINGIIMPDIGHIEIMGKVSALIEVGAGFHPMLTGRENIYVSGTILGMAKKEIKRKFDEIVEFSGCKEFLDTPVKYYSNGMYARLGFAIAIQIKPDILIIDEVMSVGDMKFRIRCFNEIYKLLDKTAVIFVSHNLPDISRICNNLLVMNMGKCVYNSHDVTKGISIYQSFLKEQETIIFNYKASLKNISLLDEKGIETLLIQYGSNISLIFDMEVDNEYAFIDVNIMISNQDMQNVMQCSSMYSGYEIRNAGVAMRVKVDLGNIYLNSGNYSLSLGITSKHHGENLAKYANIIKFQVTGHAIGYAPLQIPGHWEIRH